MTANMPHTGTIRKFLCLTPIQCAPSNAGQGAARHAYLDKRTRAPGRRARSRLSEGSSLTPTRGRAPDETEHV